MCGILFQLSRQPLPPAPEPLVALVSNRGPDCCNSHTFSYTPPSVTSVCHLQFTSTVLSLRGDHVTPQPLICPDTCSVLCWNGEAWRINGEALPSGRNDTEAVFGLLVHSLSNHSTNRIREFANIINSISGPFAFVFFDNVNGRLWFGRDCLGRRSLLLHRTCVDKDGYDGIVVASVTDGDREKSWEEVEADGIYYIDLAEYTGRQNVIRRIPFLQQGETGDNEIECSMNLPYPPLNRFITNVPPPSLNRSSSAPEELKACLQESIRLRVQNIFTPEKQLSLDTLPRKSKIAILFSGGLDCTVLARLAHEVLPLGEPIDLLNVAFENPRVVEARANGPTPPKNKKKSITADGIDPYSLCPDRITCISSLKELQYTCPTRQFNLVFINVPLSEMLEHKQKVISLIYPHNTEMDLSIALAFYFASRGSGVLKNSASTPASAGVPYTTPARVLLSGLGADELFGGYARHHTAFLRGGYKALLAELELDVGRLGKRNLGRDDRVISHWGKEGRYPYLDERLVGWALSKPVWEKCNFEKDGEEGKVEGGKKVLRLIAQLLGMKGVSGEKKRAIQFGARTAKMETG
ncbi:asparagine synthase-domain-containing protein, partial [Kalaharituber pfeilii]